MELKADHCNKKKNSSSSNNSNNNNRDSNSNNSKLCQDCGNKPQLPRVDLRKANQGSFQEISFNVKLKGSALVHIMSWAASEVIDIFKDICEKLDIQEDGVIIQYPLREEDGDAPAIISIVNDRFVAKTLKAVFGTCEEFSTIIVDLPPSKSSSRGYRPCEMLYNTIIKKDFTVDVRFYELLLEHPDTVEKFLTKRLYICLLLGKDCLNFVNPAVFICHIPGCQKLEKLGSFNNISRIIHHSKEHVQKKNQCAKTILKRHYFLTGNDVETDENQPTADVAAVTHPQKKKLIH